MSALPYEPDQDASALVIAASLLELSADELRALRERIEQFDEWLQNRRFDGERG